MCNLRVNNIKIMKPLAYTGSRKRSLMPLFVPEKEIFDTSSRSWESFVPFLKLFTVPEETKEHKDPLFWSNHCPRIKRAIADSFERTRWIILPFKRIWIMNPVMRESGLIVSVQQVIPATLRVLVLTGRLSKTRITSWIARSITRNEPDLSRERLFREHLSKTN